MSTPIREIGSTEGQIGIFLGKRQWKLLLTDSADNGLAELINAAQELGVSPLWFSLPQNVSQIGNTIEGAILSKGMLHLNDYPLPKVVYDRATFRQSDREKAAIFRAGLAALGVKFVNAQAAFPKWGTYRNLKKDPFISAHLPKTIRFCRTLNLEEMLKENANVCVKSNWGSRGMEILFIKMTDEIYQMNYPNGASRLFSDFNDVTQAVYRFMGNKDTIIQAVIPLASFKGNVFDARVLMQKSASHSWICTAIALRKAPEGRLTTNAGLGGEVLAPLTVLENVWPGKGIDILEQIKMLGYQTCHALEENYGSLGELGLDIGIDEEGEVWLLEVNGKPAKTTVRKLMQESITKEAYQRPLIYAQTLLEEVLE